MKIKICELCGTDWFDSSFGEEEIAEENMSIAEEGRCIGCYEEWGDGYPDRF
jgi:hypothetical protein